MPTGSFDISELKRRMQGATQSLKHELGGLRTGRAAASMLEPVQVDAYGTHMPLNQLATISVPEPRLLSVQVWDKSMVKAVEKAIVDSNLGLSPATEGQVLRLRIPELNEDRRKELVKVAHKYAEAARVAVRHVRRDGFGDRPFACCQGEGNPHCLGILCLSNDIRPGALRLSG
jgi:ribosome recycling factor